MTRLVLTLSTLGAIIAVPLACSQPEPGSRPGQLGGGGTMSGAGGNAGVVGVGSVGGTSAPGIGGVGILNDAGLGSMGGTDSDATVICDELNVSSKPVVPTVLILVDNSSSMFQLPQNATVAPWDELYSALMDPTMGVIKPLEGVVRFGFANFRGNPMGTLTDDDPACAEITRVPYALNNFAAIDTVYAQLGTERYNPTGGNWETPTGFAIKTLAAELAAYEADPPGPKYILVVTDGDPNTCMVPNPQCGQDQSIKAVQDAYALGIGTYAIGIGDVTNFCDGQAGRCGPDHIQDLANAGQGLPVMAPPEAYSFQQCVAGNNGGVGGLQATYAAAGVAPGTATAYTATNSAELTTAISDLLVSVISCTLDMNAIVTGNPSLGEVTVNGAAIEFNGADGWSLEANNYQVTLHGTACETFKAGNADVGIVFPCDPVTGEPIADPIE